MDMYLQAIALVDTNSITFVVYGWGVLCAAILITLPAILNWDNGLDYHNMRVLTDAQLEEEFFGYTLEKEAEALSVVTRLYNRMVKKAMVFTVPAAIAALPSQEEVDVQEAPAIPGRWDSVAVTEKIVLPLTNEEFLNDFNASVSDSDDDLDALWDRIDATKYAPTTFNQYMRVA